MQTVPISVVPPSSRSQKRPRPRTALVASADRSFRERLTQVLIGLRWQVREAEGGAQAWSEAETMMPGALIVDAWLPDLDLSEFVRDFECRFPEVDLLIAAAEQADDGHRGPYRQELLYALRQVQANDTASWNAAPSETLRATNSTSIAKDMIP